MGTPLHSTFQQAWLSIFIHPTLYHHNLQWEVVGVTQTVGNGDVQQSNRPQSAPIGYFQQPSTAIFSQFPASFYPHIIPSHPFKCQMGRPFSLPHPSKSLRACVDRCTYCFIFLLYMWLKKRMYVSADSASKAKASTLIRPTHECLICL